MRTAIALFVSLADYVGVLLTPNASGQLTPLDQVLQSFGISPSQIASARDRIVASLEGFAGSVVPLLTGLVGVVLDVILVAMLSIYLLADGVRVADWLRQNMPERQQGRIWFRTNCQTYGEEPMTAVQEKRERVQWERMLPQEFRAAMSALPVVFLPLGTVEWHGEHNALGLDSLKAHALCVHAAQQVGGVVHPPLFGGMGGLDMPATVVIEEEFAWENYLLRPWLEKLCSEFQRIGFRAVIMLTGHYGHNQQIVVRETAARMTQRLQIPVLGTPEYWLAQDAGYEGDHAGIGETSLLWHLHPELVAIERIRQDPDYGKTDAIEKGSSPELGQKYAELIVERLAQLAVTMVEWDETTRAAFVRSERALVDAQVRGWRTQHAWAAWDALGNKGLREYGAFLVAQDFASITAMAEQL